MIRWCRVAKHVLHHLTPVDWIFVNFKVALGIVWPFFYFSGDPVRPQGTDGFFLYLWCGFTVVGFIVSLTGLILAAQPRRFRYSGRQIEIAGIWLFMGGPVCYGILQAGLLVDDGNTVRGAQIAMAYALTAALAARILIVKDGVRQEARAPGDDA